MNRFIYYMILLLSFSSMTMTSCTKDDTDPVDTTVTDTTSILVSYNPAGSFSYFSFEKGELLTVADAEASAEWDFGLKFINFAVNGGTKRAGKGGAIIMDGLFENVLEAPESGYKVDTDSTFAINSEWYSYNSTTHSFAPIAGKIFIFKTGQGKYAKMEIISALPTDDNGNLVIPPVLPTKIKYTFRYTFQADGSRQFN